MDKWLALSRLRRGFESLWERHFSRFSYGNYTETAFRSYANSRVWVPYAHQPKSEREALRLARRLTREGRDVLIRSEREGITAIRQMAAVPMT